MIKEFKKYAINMNIIIKNILIELHHCIGMLEFYYRPLQYIYSIFRIKIPIIKPDFAL